MTAGNDPETVPETLGNRIAVGVNAGLRLPEIRARMTLWPWWVHVSGIYLAARLVSALIFMAAALHQGINPWVQARPDYWSFINIWDARWYGEALRNGYPAVLPVNAAGQVQENAWAFYPLFPTLGRVLSGVTGTGPEWSLTVIAMVCGLGAALVVYRLFRLRAGHPAALWGTAFFATFPVSAVLQVPYAESLNVLLLSTALLLVIQRRYLWAMPVVVLMSLSRPTGVPFAAMMVLLFLARLWQFRAGRGTGALAAAALTEPAPHRTKLQSTMLGRTVPHSAAQLWQLAVLTAVGSAAALLWPLIAWAATGDIAAYTKTETAWRGGGLVPFEPWFETGTLLFGPALGLIAPYLLVATFALLLMSRPVAALGLELRLWCGCYVGYLLVFLHPQTSTFRMLLPLFPLALGAVLVSRSRAYRSTVVVMFVLLQIVWIVWLWAWAQLPGGGDYPP